MEFLIQELYLLLHSLYRYILGNLVHNRLTRISEISHELGINRKIVERYAKALNDNGIYRFGRRKQLLIDGYVQVYHGYGDNLDKKHVSRLQSVPPFSKNSWETMG